MQQIANSRSENYEATHRLMKKNFGIFSEIFWKQLAHRATAVLVSKSQFFLPTRQLQIWKNFQLYQLWIWGRLLVDHVDEWFSVFFIIYRCVVGASGNWHGGSHWFAAWWDPARVWQQASRTNVEGNISMNHHSPVIFGAGVTSEGWIWNRWTWLFMIESAGFQDTCIFDSFIYVDYK